MRKYPIPLTVIAQEVEKSPAHISKILNGRPCRMELGQKIAQAMHMSFDEWFRTYQDPHKDRAHG